MAFRWHKWTLATRLTWVCVLCLSTGGLAAEIAASLDRDTIYLGTQTLLIVEVVDPTTSDWPVVAPVDGLEIGPYGAPGIIQDLFAGTIRRSYRFLITPTRAGTFEIPSVTVGKPPNTATQGPFTLHVQEAPLKFLSAQLDPPQIRTGETAMLTVTYQGIAPGKDLVVPPIQGLTMRSLGSPRIEITRPHGMPVSRFSVEITGVANGSYQIQDISLAGVVADPVTIQVSPFVIVDAQAADSSLVVGGQTLVHVATRGLPQTDNVSLVLPPGLTAQRTKQQYQGPPGTTVFSFEVTAAEPGSPTITEIQLADGRKAPLPRPIVLSVRQGGQGDILACRGGARTAETVVGEPFIVDYEVFFRGELQAAGIDLSQAAFAGRPHILVDPVQNLSYDGWSGQPIRVRFGEKGQAVLLSGSGDLDGRKEQLLRFALKITPLAAGEVDLRGLRIILRLVIREEQRSFGAFFSSMRTQDFSRLIDAPPHRVIDPPGVAAPPGYRGAVGTAFTYVTSLDRTTATAMSPLTLTMKITGDSVTGEFKPPPLAEIRELNRDFDVSPTVGGGDVQDRTITFTQVIRPRSESVKELPALPLVYYDYVKKSYETVYSLPIPITVTPGSVVGSTAMQTGAPAAAEPAAGQKTPSPEPTPTEVVALGANYATLGELHAEAPLAPAGVIAVLAGGPVAVAGVWAVRKWRDRRRPLASLRRRQRELIRLLDQAAAQENVHAYLADLVQSYLRLTFDLPAGELSPDMLAGTMERKGVGRGLRGEIEELLAACDRGRFAPGQANESERSQLIERARGLLAQLDRV